MNFLRSIVFFMSAAAVGAACTDEGGGEGDQGDDCPVGSEGCPCRDGACDGALECRSSLCVEGGGGTGGAAGSSAGTSGTATGGGAGVGVGGTGDSGGTGGSSSGGVPQGGVGGTSGAGGSGPPPGGAGSGGSGGSTCSDTTSDPNNCGACGHVCESSVCMNGQCTPYPGACFVEADGFTTCAAYCQSVGETCVFSGCGGGSVTVYSWPSEDASLCPGNPGTANSRRQAPCDLALEFDPGAAFYRCCCTDTQ